MEQAQNENSTQNADYSIEQIIIWSILQYGADYNIDQITELC